MTRFKFQSPLLSQYSGHLVYSFPHFFSAFSLIETHQSKKISPSTLLYKAFPSLFPNATQFRRKNRSVKSAFPKLCAYLVCGERKKGEKRNLLLCHQRFFLLH